MQCVSCFCPGAAFKHFPRRLFNRDLFLNIEIGLDGSIWIKRDIKTKWLRKLCNKLLSFRESKTKSSLKTYLIIMVSNQADYSIAQNHPT